MAQAGGYSESGRPLTDLNAVASHRLTRLRRAATAVASTATVPAASRTRGSASTPVGERAGFLAEDRGGAGVAGPIRSLAVVSGVMDARVFHTGPAGQGNARQHREAADGLDGTKTPAHETDGTVNIYQGTYAVDNGVIIGFDVLQTG